VRASVLGLLLVSALEVFKDSIKTSVGGYYVVIIKIIFCGCFFMNMELFYSVKINNFFLDCIICIIM